MNTDYQKQATDFLERTNTTFKAEFVEHGKYFEDDKNTRDIYQVTLTRGGRVFSFRFGQSVNSSGRFWKYGDYRHGVSNGYQKKGEFKYYKPIAIGERGAWKKNENFESPSAYSVLACLQKNDPDTFENFCSEFGYDTDSRNAERIYKAVVNEWHNVAMLWNDAELELLREIQ